MGDVSPRWERVGYYLYGKFEECRGSDLENSLLKQVSDMESCWNNDVKKSEKSAEQNFLIRASVIKMK